MTSYYEPIAEFFSYLISISRGTKIDETEIQNNVISLVQHFYIGTKIKLDPGSELGSFDLGSGKMFVQPGISHLTKRTALLAASLLCLWEGWLLVSYHPPHIYTPAASPPPPPCKQPHMLTLSRTAFTRLTGGSVSRQATDYSTELTPAYLATQQFATRRRSEASSGRCPCTGYVCTGARQGCAVGNESRCIAVTVGKDRPGEGRCESGRVGESEGGRRQMRKAGRQDGDKRPATRSGYVCRPEFRTAARRQYPVHFRCRCPPCPLLLSSRPFLPFTRASFPSCGSTPFPATCEVHQHRGPVCTLTSMRELFGSSQHSRVGGNPENPMITKSGDIVWHCSSESIVYIQSSITPLDCQKIEEYVTLNEDCEASHASERERERREERERERGGAYTRQKAKLKYRNRIRFERVPQKQSSDTHKTPYDRVKRCWERTCSSTHSGEPIKKKRVDGDGNIYFKEIGRPKLVEEYHMGPSAIEVHNHIRQDGLSLETSLTLCEEQFLKRERPFRLIDREIFFDLFPPDSSDRGSLYTEDCMLMGVIEVARMVRRRPVTFPREVSKTRDPAGSVASARGISGSDEGISGSEPDSRPGSVTQGFINLLRRSTLDVRLGDPGTVAGRETPHHLKLAMTNHLIVCSPLS
ncbi:hypothetical protein PR048_002925 [Dryococelus australis]|uniref:Uncharacterized protein n=1 Tax=Dryococelus australis TaxID=614101 RepID=A0ABQ9IMM5_9NEOP|nr:hypothetical protein PR048_002925 [Dryococelus australis]